MNSIERIGFFGFAVVSLVVIAFAAWARLHGLDHGLPFIFDRDEQAFVLPALKIVDSGDLNPGWFGHPASTVIYAGAVIAFFTSLFSDQGVLASYYQDPTTQVYLQRLFCALLGVAAVPATFLLAERATRSRIAGLIAAAVVAILPIHIDMSRIVRSDAVATTFILFAAYFALRALETGRLRDYLLHGVLVGLATMTKWPAVTVAFTIVVVHLMRPAPIANWRLPIAAGIASIVTAFVVAPYVFIDIGTVLTNLRAEGRSENYGATGEGFFGNLVFYGKVFVERLGWWVLIPAFVGVVTTFRPFDRRMFVLFLYGVLFTLFLASLNLKYARWAMPVYPVIAVFFGFGVVQVLQLVQQHFIRQIPVAPLAVVLAALLLIQMTTTALWRVDVMTRLDTRVVSRDWILENVPAGTTILVEAYTPQLPVDVYNLGQWGRGRNKDKFTPAPTGTYRNFIAGAFSGEADYKKVIADGKPAYIVMSSTAYDRFNRAGFEQQKQNVAEIFKLGPVVFEVRPGKGAGVGPVISVIKLD